MTDVVDGFAELFQGRMDAYGAGGDSPYADKVPQGDWAEYHRRITAHLDGTAPVGVYPQRQDGTVKWGCTDLDNGEPDLQNALNIQAMFDAIGIASWVERSRSKGFHVWVFANEWVPADVMRRAFLAVHQKLEIPAKEINPKQTNLEEGQIGNWVRLPYPGGLNLDIGPHLERQVVLGCTGVHDFVDRALLDATSLYPLDTAANHYVAPPPREHIQIGTPSGPAAQLQHLLTGDAAMFWKNGTRDPDLYDRSNSLVRFAHMMKEQGNISPADALVLLREADARHGQKFLYREDGETHLNNIIERVF